MCSVYHHSGELKPGTTAEALVSTHPDTPELFCYTGVAVIQYKRGVMVIFGIT
jgi:hypothetical protein